MSDLISRQAVIDHINRLIEVEKKQGTDDWGYGLERVNAYEAMLHFVKSEYLYPSVEPEKCGDCISREAAKSKAVYSYERHEKVVPVAELDWLPSVEPKRKVGHWIEHEWAQELDGEGYLISNFECDKCHAWAGADYDYCPNCGVKMEEKV